MTPRRQLVTGLLTAAGIVALWTGLTALTGKTYHLAPLLAALAPGLSVRLLGSARRSYPLATAAALLGAAIAALGWGLIVAWGIEPTATIVGDQPGGRRRRSTGRAGDRIGGRRCRSQARRGPRVGRRGGRSARHARIV